MESRLPDILKMKDVHNLAETWRKWKKAFMMYVKAAGVKDEDGRYVALLCTVGGPEMRELHDNFRYAEGEDEDNFKCIIKKFDDICLPRNNLQYDRHRFFTRVQESGETIQQFVTELRTIAKACKLNEMTEDECILHRLILGVQDKQL